MPTQGHEEKRVEERASMQGREGEEERERRSGGRGRERERERERESTLVPLFMFFFLPPGPALCKLGLVITAVLPEVLTPVLGPWTFL